MNPITVTYGRKILGFRRCFCRWLGRSSLTNHWRYSKASEFVIGCCQGWLCVYYLVRSSGVIQCAGANHGYRGHDSVGCWDAACAAIALSCEYYIRWNQGEGTRKYQARDSTGPFYETTHRCCWDRHVRHTVTISCLYCSPFPLHRSRCYFRIHYRPHQLQRNTRSMFSGKLFACWSMILRMRWVRLRMTLALCIQAMLPSACDWCNV